MEEPNPYESPIADRPTPDAGKSPSQSVRSPAFAARGSLFVAVILIVFDVILYGSFLTSYLVFPVWFLVSVVKGGRGLANGRDFGLLGGRGACLAGSFGGPIAWTGPARHAGVGVEFIKCQG